MMSDFFLRQMAKQSFLNFQSESQDTAEWFDLAGLLPPLPLEASQKIKEKFHFESHGQHTFLPHLITRDDFSQNILPVLKSNLSQDMLEFIQARVEKTFEIRHKLKSLQKQIVNIVGAGNFSALWLDREAFSADSMEHRALVTEAVVHVYSAQALQEIVTLFYEQQIPMIPYGEGGGYNMGVTPMAAAVTISPRGIDHISEITPSARDPKKFQISVGAGVPFKDLTAYLSKRGYVLRCNPNTPRAATGGIAATGSNGGRKAFEVVLHGRAVVANGTAVCFAADAKETECLLNEPFLLARKFFSIENLNEFKSTFLKIKKAAPKACVTSHVKGVVIPLQGMKSQANMLAQKATHKAPTIDTMEALPKLPMSAFVGAEGCTGFIYEVTFEIERPLPWLQAGRWHFNTTDDAVRATQAIKKLPLAEQPEYFEFISGPSIRRYLLQDFPTVFSPSDEAVMIFAVEGKDKIDCERKFALSEHAIQQAMAVSNSVCKGTKTLSMLQSDGIEEFEIMRRPREELPKKLRTKCKTDMEIRTEYLGDVLKIVEATQPKKYAEQTQDVLFGHLTPRHTAIIHWNIGGFDLYDEEQADAAWDYLETVIGQAQSLAPSHDTHGSARFTGEHGVAGKAPFLWINYIPPEDFKRMCAIKDILDPQDLFNPETIFLRTSHARALRARLLNTSALRLQKSSVPLEAQNYVIAEGQRCTRCNSCKICPVIDAEHELAREGNGKRVLPVLPSKRNILMFLERLAHVRKSGASAAVLKATQNMLKESASLLAKCFYCRRCDKACPVDIQIHPLMRAYHEMGKLPSMGSKFWKFIYERLMGEDAFKALTYRLLALFCLLGKPFLFVLRKLSFVPDWFKTYTVPPTLSLAHYECTSHGVKLASSDNFVLIGNEFKETSATHVYIRYRGCMDTFGNPAATTSVDAYFKTVLKVRLVDLEKKMCCGFPFEADGLHERAKQSQLLSVIEIAKCIQRLVEEVQAAQEMIPQFTVFSNCPTCAEALREMKLLFKDEKTFAMVRARAQLKAQFDVRHLDFAVKDTAEVACDLLVQSQAQKTNTEPYSEQIQKKVGLKVPCHNTPSATTAQLALLKMYYTGVSAYDRCCGLSGTGRLKHPKIGTKIAEKLFEQIREHEPEVVVSGCPSCRDGVKIQRDIVASKQDSVAEFAISGIFEQILRDVFPLEAEKKL